MDCYTTFWLRDGVTFEDCLALFSRLGTVEESNATWARFRWMPVPACVADAYRDTDGGHSTFAEQSSMLGFRARPNVGPILSWTTPGAGLFDVDALAAGAANLLRVLAIARLFVEADLAACVAAGGTGFEIDASLPTPRTLARTAFFSPASLAPDLGGFVRLGDVMLALDATRTISDAGALAAASGPQPRFSPVQLELAAAIDAMVAERVHFEPSAHSRNGSGRNGRRAAVVGALQNLEAALERLRDAMREEPHAVVTS
jgi:hypothetical protein